MSNDPASGTAPANQGAGDPPDGSSTPDHTGHNDHDDDSSTDPPADTPPADDTDARQSAPAASGDAANPWQEFATGRTRESPSTNGSTAASAAGTTTEPTTPAEPDPDPSPRDQDSDGDADPVALPEDLTDDTDDEHAAAADHDPVDVDETDVPEWMEWLYLGRQALAEAYPDQSAAAALPAPGPFGTQLRGDRLLPAYPEATAEPTRSDTATTPAPDPTHKPEGNAGVPEYDEAFIPEGFWERDYRRVKPQAVEDSGYPSTLGPRLGPEPPGEHTVEEPLGSDVSPADTTPLQDRGVNDPDACRLKLPFRDEPADLVRNSPLEIEDRYWLNRPFAYATIFYNTRTHEHIYRVIEPTLDEHEATLYDELTTQLREQLQFRVSASDDVDRAEKLEEKAREVIGGLAGFDVADPSFERVLYYLRRDMLASYYGRVDPLMRDERVEEISVDGPGIPTYVYHREYESIKTNIQYQEEELRRFVKQLAQRAGNDISTAHPTEGMALPDGSRIQLSLEDIAPRGETFTIRKHSETPFTPVDLIDLGTFSAEQMAYLWVLIEEGYSGIIAGGTNTGKTSTLNALSMFIPPGDKVVTIEDTRELRMPQENHVALLTREGFSHDSEAEVGMYDLLRTALRKGPEYMVVGEVRGEEAHDMFQAMNTGHTTFSTLHADSVESAFSRLSSDPMGVERSLISELGFIAVQSLGGQQDSMERQQRRNQEIIEVKDLDTQSGEIQHRHIFELNEAENRFEKRAKSHHFQRLRSRGRDPDEALRSRKRVLEYLLENDVNGYEPVSNAIRAFQLNPEIVSEQIERGSIDFEELEAL